MSLAAGCSCEGRRRELAVAPDIAYPIAGDGQLELERTYRSGPTMRPSGLVERLELRLVDQHRRVRVRQEWPGGTADLEVIYRPDGLPLRVWRRTAGPSRTDPVGIRSTRIYGIAADGVTVAQRSPSGQERGSFMPSEQVRAVIGPGRGILTVWIQRADLAVGGRLREWALDVREPLEVIREVTLQRVEGRDVPGLGRVRVYTIYGREPVFTDNQNVVVGDLLGLREASAVAGPTPDPMPDPGPFEPRRLGR